MSLLDAYRQKLEAQIQEHKAKLDLIRARAKKVAAQGKIIGYEELAAADKHLASVKTKFQKLKGAGGEALGDLKVGVKQALADLQASTRQAARHFNGQNVFAKPPAAKPATAKHRARKRPAARAKSKAKAH